MRIAGIIAEYNPFHAGHAWHIAETRRLSGCDYVVVCMAGHFTQRGEPAVLSKWARARMALTCGADAVFDLPALFAVRTADTFARGGVMTLGGLGIDVLSFGSELDDLKTIQTLVGIQENEPKSVSCAIQQRLAAGQSHPRAWGEAVAEYLGLPAGTLNRPNLILAMEYVRALERYYPNATPCAVRRLGEYHSEAMGEIASASAIRAAMARGETDAAMAAIPEAARPWACPDAMHAMDDMLMLRLRDMTEEALRRLPDVTEGLESRLYRLCRETSTRDALLEALKCKRYTRARLSRLLTHALLGVDRAALDENPTPTYARLIGLRDGAEPLLKEISARTTLPIASSGKALEGNPTFRLECRATDVWSLLHDAPEERLPGREYTEKFVKI